ALGGLVALAASATGKANTALTMGSRKATPLEIAMAFVALGFAVWIPFVVAARLGFGPFAPPPGPDEPPALLPPPAPPPAAAWLRPGAQLGLPVVWVIACLMLLSLGMYVVVYT